MTTFIIDIEPVATRYTQQWHTHLPRVFRTKDRVRVVSGTLNQPSKTSPGAFLDFGLTNVYKGSQAVKVAEAFHQGEVRAGDRFIFADAWNPMVLQLRYMSQLLDIPIEAHGLWHAGSYDPNDFLGRLIGADPWVRHAEQAMAYAYDRNYFATEYHRKIFEDTLGVDRTRTRRVGWPMEYIQHSIAPARKRDLIVFPHRLAPEKQLDIFEDLRKRLPQYEFVVCQQQQLSKPQYHKLLAEAKIVFSANLQETLGISWYEGICAGATPVVPHRLSYAEMAPDICYPSEWTRDWSAYRTHATKITKWIKDAMSMDHTQRITQTARLRQQLEPYFSSDQLKGFIDAQ